MFYQDSAFRESRGGMQHIVVIGYAGCQRVRQSLKCTVVYSDSHVFKQTELRINQMLRSH